MTFEITKDHDLTRRGDCIIAVNANKAPKDLSIEFKKACKRDGSKITMKLEAGGVVDFIEGLGSPNLSFAHPTEMVGRKSLYVSDRTIMVRANKAAWDLDRRLIEALKSPKSTLTVLLTAQV